MNARKPKMKGTLIAKIFVDIAMIVLYLELMYAYDASPLFHEIAGIGIVGLFIAHYVLNWKPLKAMFKQALKGKLSFPRWVLLISDVILPFCMAFCVITGLLVTRILFVGPCFGDVASMHDISANVCLWIMVIHLVFHASFLRVYARHIMRCNVANKAFGTVAACAMVGVLVGLCFTTNIVEDESPVALQSSSDSKQASKTKPEIIVNRTETDDSADAAVVESSASLTGSSATESSSSSTDAALKDSPSSSTEQITQGQAAEEDSTTVPVCTLCRRMCPVTNLLCDRGVQWAQSNNYL